jgi:hypothetical protein
MRPWRRHRRSHLPRRRFLHRLALGRRVRRPKLLRVPQIRRRHRRVRRPRRLGPRPRLLHPLARKRVRHPKKGRNLPYLRQGEARCSKEFR